MATFFSFSVVVAKEANDGLPLFLTDHSATFRYRDFSSDLFTTPRPPWSSHLDTIDIGLRVDCSGCSSVLVVGRSIVACRLSTRLEVGLSGYHLPPMRGVVVGRSIVACRVCTTESKSVRLSLFVLTSMWKRCVCAAVCEQLSLRMTSIQYCTVL